jgi:hypothetical protein
MLPALVGGTLLPLASGGSELYKYDGDKENDRMGIVVAPAGDVNGDGRPDFLVGAPEDNSVFFVGEGYVRIYSGETGLPIRTLNGVALGDGFGMAAAGIGDVNGDGRAEVAVGAPFSGGGGEVSIYSGLDGTRLVLYTHATQWAEMGSAVAAAGDVNGDGTPDVIAGGAQSGDGSGEAVIVSGSNGAVLRSFVGGANERLGFSVAGLGDLNADGRGDVAIGSRAQGVKVYSGATGAVLFNFPQPASSDHYGFSVANAGDVNGDGKKDLIVGAPQDLNFFLPGKGYAQVRSGANGAILWTLVGDTDGDLFGSAVGGAGDFNGDGVADLIVGATQNTIAGNGYVRVFSGANGSTLETFAGLASFDRFGYSVAGLGDLDGDGSAEVAIGAPTADENAKPASGSAYLYSGVVVAPPPPACTEVPTNFCSTRRNSVGPGAVMTWRGTNSIAANDFKLVSTGVRPLTSGLFIQGSHAVSVPLGDGLRCVGGTVLMRIWPPVQSTAGGSASYLMDYNNPSDPAGRILAGSTWYFQFWYRDPGFGSWGFNLSDGLQVTFCP